MDIKSKHLGVERAQTNLWYLPNRGFKGKFWHLCLGSHFFRNFNSISGSTKSFFSKLSVEMFGNGLAIAFGLDGQHSAVFNPICWSVKPKI